VPPAPQLGASAAGGADEGVGAVAFVDPEVLGGDGLDAAGVAEDDPGVGPAVAAVVGTGGNGGVATGPVTAAGGDVRPGAVPVVGGFEGLEGAGEDWCGTSCGAAGTRITGVAPPVGAAVVGAAPDRSARTSSSAGEVRSMRTGASGRSISGPTPGNPTWGTPGMPSSENTTAAT
jgi:hypothetical protein